MCRFKGRKKVAFFSPFQSGHVLSGLGRKGSYGFFVFSHFEKVVSWVGCGGGGVVWLFLKKEVVRSK